MQKKQRKKADFSQMKGMSFGQAVDWLFVNFKYHILVGLILVLFIVFLYQAAFGGQNEPVFTGLVAVPAATQEGLDSAAAGFGLFVGLDQEKEKATMVLGDPAAAETEQGIQELVMTVAQGQADVMVTDAPIADGLLKNGALSDLQVVLPAEALTRYADRLWYADADALGAWMEASKAGNATPDLLQLRLGSDGMTTPVPVGLDMDAGARRTLGLPEDGEPMVLTVAVTLRHPERAADFLRYLYGDFTPFAAQTEAEQP